MKSKKPFVQFMKGFFKSCFWSLLLLLTAVISYKVTYWYCETHGGDRSDKAKELADSITDANTEIPENPATLILGVDEQRGAIKSMIVEILSTEEQTLCYITIPPEFTIELPNELYRKLFTLSEEVPQILTISHMADYFEGTAGYDYAKGVLQEVLATKIDYYAILTNEEFLAIFHKDEAGVFQFSAAEEEIIESIETKEDVEERITSFYKVCSSDLKESLKCRYSRDYQSVGRYGIEFLSLPGTWQNGQFLPDLEQCENLFADGSSAVPDYEEPEDTPKIPELPEDISVEILNATTITGLAASYQEKLAGAGITDITIGNYADNSQETTIIYIKEEAYEQPLKELIPFGEVWQDSSITADVRIVLGADASEE